MFSKTKLLFDDMLEGKFDSQKIKEILVNMYEKGESAKDIASAASAMRDHMIPVVLDPKLQDKLIDNCGTGGDHSNTFNISTTASLLLSACGSKVAKHGNRSITSKSGSADVLEALGINLDIPLDKIPLMLQEVGFAFLFAINHHPGMKYVMPVRKSLSHRTIFNLLGPLANPAGVKKQLLGVFDKEYVLKMAQALQLLNTKRAMVVSSADGMDEISLSDVTYMAFVEGDNIDEFVFNPQDYGFELYKKEDFIGGDAKDNAKIAIDILNGKEKGAKRDIVIINTAVALFIDGKVNSINEGIELANYTIDTKLAIKHLDQIIKFSNEIK